MNPLLLLIWKVVSWTCLKTKTSSIAHKHFRTKATNTGFWFQPNTSVNSLNTVEIYRFTLGKNRYSHRQHMLETDFLSRNQADGLQAGKENAQCFGRSSRVINIHSKTETKTWQNVNKTQGKGRGQTYSCHKLFKTAGFRAAPGN